MKKIRAAIGGAMVATSVLWAMPSAGAHGGAPTCDGFHATASFGPAGRHTTTLDVYPGRVVADFGDGSPASTLFVDKTTGTRTIIVQDLGGDVELTVHDGADVRRVCTGDGHDRIDVGKSSAPGVFVSTGGGNDVVRGSNQADRIFTGPGSDTAYGYGGNDWIDGGSGTNTIDGGVGTDSCSFTPDLTRSPGCESGLTVQSTRSAPAVRGFGG